MSAGAPTILIVDDELLNRRLLEALLQPEGYRTLTATSGEEALASVADNAPDLILLDIMMPGMDGYAVACELKANPATASIPIVMVTAQIDRAARLRGLDAGAEDFLLKPVDRAELSLRIRNHLRIKVEGDVVRQHASTLAEEVQARTADLERFRSAMDTTADAIFLTSRTTMRLVEVNATATKMLGYSREELLGAGPLAMDGAVARREETYDAIIAGDHANDVVETEIRRRDGTMLPVEIHLHAQRSGDDWIIVSVMSDVTARKEAEGRLHRLAHYDAVTHLPNRTLFYETLEKTVAMAGERGWVVSVLFIDLDHFKDVNDTLGHETGDLVLRQVGDRLLGCLRVRDTVGRLGGDEFAAIVVTEDDGKSAAVVATKVQNALSAPFHLNGRDVVLTASIGIAMFPADATDPATLVKYADTAMYRAKQAGRDTARFFTSQMNTDIVERQALQVALQEAIAQDRFVLHYQPKLDARTGRIAGVEALLRWMRPGVGLVPPMDFIPALEESGLIREVGRWVIDSACQQIADWARSGVGPVPVAVNVSARQFFDGTLDTTVLDALVRHDVDPALLELELTESTLMANTAETIASLRALKARGVRVSIDDFGTGYSSLAYLSRFPIDTLKIDIAFVRHITRSSEDAAIARAIIALGHSLRMEVVAEGVETEGQLAYLRQHGCDQVQGHLLSRPVPAGELAAMIREGERFGPIARRCPPSTLASSCRPGEAGGPVRSRVREASEVAAPGSMITG